jgi:hypothetical protein
VTDGIRFASSFVDLAFQIASPVPMLGPDRFVTLHEEVDQPILLVGEKGAFFGCEHNSAPYDCVQSPSVPNPEIRPSFRERAQR